MDDTHKVKRYVWVHIIPDDDTERFNVSLWVSPDKNGRPFPGINTPHIYRLTRNDVVYTVESEVLLSQALAIRIAGTMYDTEFALPLTRAKKARR